MYTSKSVQYDRVPFLRQYELVQVQRVLSCEISGLMTAPWQIKIWVQKIMLVLSSIKLKFCGDYTLLMS